MKMKAVRREASGVRSEETVRGEALGVRSAEVPAGYPSRLTPRRKDLSVSDLSRGELLLLIKRLCFRVTQRDLWLARYEYTSALGLRLMDEAIRETEEARKKGSRPDYLKGSAKFDRAEALCSRARRNYERAMNSE